MDQTGVNKINEQNSGRRKICFPNKLKRFKPPLVASKDFPSRVSLNKEYQMKFEEIEESREYDLYLESQMKQEPEKAPITHWRRAEYFDTEALLELIKKFEFNTNDLFREPDVPELIEKASFPLIQFNSKQEIISFTCIFSYPDIPAVPAFEWYPWLDKLYSLADATPRNCFFIHYMVWKSEYYHDFLRLALETIFLENSFLNSLIITKPPKAKLPSIIPENFIQVLPNDAKTYDCDCNSLQTILLCLRYSFMDRLKIRLALVEDHDDLMPIAEQHTDRLRALYGDYCMAEIIEYPGTKERRTLVCEYLGYAVGFMILNKAVDFDLLNSQFDLSVFHGLKKPNEQDKLAEPYPEDPEQKSVFLSEKVDPLLEIIDSEAMMKFLNWKPSLCVGEDDMFFSETSSSEGKEKRYNEISSSLSDFIRETLNTKLAPKFSAHALSITSSISSTKNNSDSLGTTERFAFGESDYGEESLTQSESSLLSLQHYNLPTYNGPPNAFLIEFFAMHNEFDDRLCQDFLEAAFEEFSDLEYCLLTIPSQSPTFPLLDFFTRVTPRPLKRFRQELYVCHRSCVMITFMRVRKVTKADLNEVQTLLKGIRNQDCIFADIASSCYYENSAYQGFVLICSKSIVGVAVLCNEYGMEYLAHHYHVSDLIDFDLHKIDYHAVLKHLVLSPIYQPHARFFLRDIMRMADVTSLYRTRYEEVESNWNKSSLITVLGQLIPVRPRRMVKKFFLFQVNDLLHRDKEFSHKIYLFPYFYAIKYVEQVKYHEESLEPNIPPPYFRYIELPFSLFHINSTICQIKKCTCNINLVVVGTSRTAYSFLENLLFSPSIAYVTYHNITWVSPHGMGTELPSHTARDLMFPYEGKYNRFYKIQICLKTYVHFVYGVMTEINRIDKYITINNDSILPYDYLILLCGRQYMMPIPLTLMPDSKVCRRNYRPRCSLFKYLITQQPKEEEAKPVYPANMFLINTDVDATNAFISLQYLYQRRKSFLKEEKIIVYGHNISTYLCIQALLKYDVEPKIIVLVEPFPVGTFSTSCFKDDNIDNAVLKSLDELGITHYKGYFLYDWTLCNKNQIKFATFHSEHHKVTIKCLAFFPFEKKCVSDVTFKAVNEASLVYDGKLVINHNFQTNDTYIYAAGGLTKYQRKYYAKDKNHKYYSSSEVGKHLAEIVSYKIDPTKEPPEEGPSDLVPDMTAPLILYGILPGEWHYLCVRKPGKFVHPETQAGVKEFGDVLITGDCEMTNGLGYFKLTLDDYGCVSGIFCYTKAEIDVQNLEMLYGKHEKLLNNLLLRFDLGLINDFYSYFREPWVYALFHDRFKLLSKQNTEIFYREKISENGNKFIDIIINALKENNWQRLPQKKLNEIKEKFEKSELQAQIKNNILAFLTYFDEPFPMYATSRILRVLLNDANTSLLHKSNKESSLNHNASIKISEYIRQN